MPQNMGINPSFFRVSSRSVGGRVAGFTWSPSSMPRADSRAKGWPVRQPCAVWVAGPGKVDPIARHCVCQPTVGFRPWALYRVEVIEDVNQLGRVIRTVVVAVVPWRMAIEIIDVGLVACFSTRAISKAVPAMKSRTAVVDASHASWSECTGYSLKYSSALAPYLALDPALQLCFCNRGGHQCRAFIGIRTGHQRMSIFSSRQENLVRISRQKITIDIWAESGDVPSRPVRRRNAGLLNLRLLALLLARRSKSAPIFSAKLDAIRLRCFAIVCPHKPSTLHDCAAKVALGQR